MHEGIHANSGTIIGESPFTGSVLVQFPTNSVSQLLRVVNILKQDYRISGLCLIGVSPNDDSGDYNWSSVVDRENIRPPFAIDQLHDMGFWNSVTMPDGSRRAIFLVDDDSLNEAWRMGGDFDFYPFRGDYIPQATTHFENFIVDLPRADSWAHDYINLPAAWVFNEAGQNHERQNVKVGIIDGPVMADHSYLNIPSENIKRTDKSEHEDHGTIVMGIIGAIHFELLIFRILPAVIASEAKKTTALKRNM